MADSLDYRTGQPTMPEPLAYFLTWTTYGTWLPGDERGWVRRNHGFQMPDPILELECKARMTEDAVRLDHEQRRLVEETIARHCQIRRWTLHVVNCRSNHVHVVVTANEVHPDTVREQFKAWCTRRLKEFELKRKDASESRAGIVRENWWTEGGSGRYINDYVSLDAVIQYVMDRQD